MEVAMASINGGENSKERRNSMIKGTWKRRCRIVFFCVMASVALAAATPANAHDHRRHAWRIPLKEATMIIEYNDTAEDVGVQFFLDSDGWREIEIFDPRRRQIFGAETNGRLTRQGGGTELFLESVEPSLEELPMEKFFRRFPKGTYRFRGRDNDGNRLTGEAEFTHDIPAGPVMVRPLTVPEEGYECEMIDVNHVVIEWEPVKTDIDGSDLEIVRYEVIVENDDLNFDVKLPAPESDGSTLTLTVPPELLQPDTEYIGEVLAVEESGNQTITEFCFMTEKTE
jgi:hypothetical protein